MCARVHGRGLPGDMCGEFNAAENREEVVGLLVVEALAEGVEGGVFGWRWGSRAGDRFGEMEDGPTEEGTMGVSQEFEHVLRWAAARA
jgi:hypothetical protein